jgi:hypothetical protein
VTDAALTTFIDELAGAVADHTLPPSLQPEEERHGTDSGGEADGVRRILLSVDGLAVRRGGAVGLCEALAATPGVVHVSLDPWTGLVAVDHDPTRCSAEQLMVVLEEPAAAQLAG